MKHQDRPRRESLFARWGSGEASKLSKAVQSRLESGLAIRDLITANPQEHGFAFPDALLQNIIAEASRESRIYRPDPRGALAARGAAAEYHGNGISPEHVILTPGTSLGYFYAFRLLAEPGDEVLVPAPSYPLFDDLAALAGLRVRHYHLHPPTESGGAHWSYDSAEIEFQITRNTRIICVISPHNPTGTVANGDELSAITKLARKHRLAIVFDEVFREFTHPPGQKVPRPDSHVAPLVITLNGISKMLTLPGLKGAWAVGEGADTSWRDKFVAAAEYLSDTLLPVSEITQATLPRLLYEGRAHIANSATLLHDRMQQLVQEWASAFAELRIASETSPAMPEAGSYLPISLPSAYSASRAEALTLKLARDQGILVHEGALYSMPSPSLITTAISAPPWPLEQIVREIHAAPD